MLNLINFKKNKTVTIRLSLKIDNRTIEQIPEFFFDFYDCKRYVQLTLNLDNLKRLRAADLNEFINLETLEIVANELLEIDENSLNELKKLKNFHLEANNLPLIPESIFFNLKFLHTLKLVLNRVNWFPSKLFMKNRSLKTLKIECYSEIRLYFLVIRCGLEVLHVMLRNENKVYSHIGEILLQYHNNIRNFKTNQFLLKGCSPSKTWKFTRLTISRSEMCNACVDIFLKHPILKYANISNNYGLNFVHFCDEIEQNSLVYLNLKCNTIAYIKAKSFQAFKNLQILDLSFNVIEEIIWTHTFSDLKNLKVLNLQNNNIFLFNVNCLKYLINLEILNLTENIINLNVFKVCKTLLKLKRFYLSSNLQETLQSFTDSKTVFPNDVLEVFDVQNNQIGHICDSFFHSMVNLKYLYLNNNQIENLHPNQFAYFQHLEYLNLSDNLIENLDGQLFSNLDKLKTLKLSNNKITHLSVDLFKNAQNLQLLDLSSNKILEIPSKIFQYNRCIRHLNLSNNNIKSIGEDTFLYSSLKCVNLKRNPLSNGQDLKLSMISGLDCLYIIDNSIINDPKKLPFQSLLKFNIHVL